MSKQNSQPDKAPDAAPEAPAAPSGEQAARDQQEPSRPDPTRFGDWEKNGRCIDF